MVTTSPRTESPRCSYLETHRDRCEEGVVVSFLPVIPDDLTQTSVACRRPARTGIIWTVLEDMREPLGDAPVREDLLGDGSRPGQSLADTDVRRRSVHARNFGPSRHFWESSRVVSFSALCS